MGDLVPLPRPRVARPAPERVPIQVATTAAMVELVRQSRLTVAEFAERMDGMRFTSMPVREYDIEHWCSPDGVFLAPALVAAARICADAGDPTIAAAICSRLWE